MICLPHCIGVGGLSTIEEIKFLAVSGSSLMGHRYQCRIEVLDNLAHPLITGWFPSLLFGNLNDLAMNSAAERGGVCKARPSTNWIACSGKRRDFPLSERFAGLASPANPFSRYCLTQS